MLSIQTEQYFPLYKFTWEKFQSTNEGTWAGKNQSIKKWAWRRIGKKKKKRFRQTLQIKGQEGDDIHLTENKCLFMNWKISFKNSYSIIFAKQVERGLWTIKKSPSSHWAHPRLHENLLSVRNWSELTPNLWQREGNVYENCHTVWGGKPGATSSVKTRRVSLSSPG